MNNIALSHQHLLGLLTNLPQQCLAQKFLVIDLLYALVEVERRHPSFSRGLLPRGIPVFGCR